MLIIFLSTTSGCMVQTHQDFAQAVKFIESKSVLKINTYDDEDNKRICSSIYLGDSKFLTAAHCFDEFVFNAEVEINQQKFSIDTLAIHPKFYVENDKFYNDVALLTFKNIPLEILNTLNPILISTNYYPEINSQIMMFGFGRTDPDNPNSSGTLHKKEMIVNNINQSFITTTSLKSFGNTCYGDSGGPAVAFFDEKPLVVGILSSGTKEDCSEGDLSLFTNLSNPEVIDFLKNSPSGNKFEGTFQN